MSKEYVGPLCTTVPDRELNDLYTLHLNGENHAIVPQTIVTNRIKQSTDKNYRGLVNQHGLEVPVRKNSTRRLPETWPALALYA